MANAVWAAATLALRPGAPLLDALLARFQAQLTQANSQARLLHRKHAMRGLCFVFCESEILDTTYSGISVVPARLSLWDSRIAVAGARPAQQGSRSAVR